MNIIQAIKDENVFKPFLGEKLFSWYNWLQALRVLYGLPLVKSRLDVITECTGRNPALLPQNGFDTALFLTGRRSGKSRMASIIGAFEGVLAGHEKKLSKGETGVVAICAPTKWQGRIVKDYIRAIFETPLLENEIENEGREGFTLTNGNEIQIMAGDFRTVRGFTLLAAIVDEVAFFGYDDECKVRSDTELIRAIKPALATVGGKLIGITTPYAQRGWCWNQYKKNYKNDMGKTLVWNCPSRTMNCTLPQQVVDDALATLIRVSTEKQKKRGESLRTQDIYLKKAVSDLGGVIVKSYAGQEHATEGAERQLFKQLLTDTSKTPKLFDAVIVTDPSRWTRDEEESAHSLKVLRKNGIRFFVMRQELNLFDAKDRAQLSMHAMMNSYQASLQKEKSIVNRIGRAKRGLPSCGKMPFGRTYNYETEKWGIDSKKQKIIKDIAKRYLSGEPLIKLAKEYQLNHPNLHKTLNQRCGTKWSLNFDSDDLKIHEKVTINIPRLLPEETIAAIRQKSEANKTYHHGQTKYQYLFARVVFCKHCGYAMFGQTNHNKKRYYRHAHAERKDECALPKAWVNAEDLEHVIIRHLFSCFGNPQAVQKAIEEATPNLEKIKEYQQRIERLNESLVKITKAREKILRLIQDDTITDEQAKKSLDELKAKEDCLQGELNQLNGSLENLPTPDTIKEISKQVSTKFRLSAKVWAKTEQANTYIDKMTWEEKRALVEMVFSGKTPDNKRMGIYIEWVDGKQKKTHKKWKYTIRGHLINEGGLLPMDESFLDSYFSIGAAQRQKALVTKNARHCTKADLP